MERGTYGYYIKYKKKKGIISGILLIGILIIVAICLVKYSTTSNVLILPAVILAIPFSKYFVAFILGLKYKSISIENKNKIDSNFIENDEVKILYDMTISAMEVVTGTPIIVIYDGNIHYIPYNKLKEKHKDIQKNVLHSIIKDAGYEDECFVTAYDNIDNLIEGVNKTIKEDSRINATRSIIERLVILCLS